MKKYFVSALTLVMVAAVMTGCGEAISKMEEKTPELEISKINVDLKLNAERGEQGVLSYSDGKKMVFEIEAPKEITYNKVDYGAVRRVGHC